MRYAHDVDVHRGRQAEPVHALAGTPAQPSSQQRQGIRPVPAPEKQAGPTATASAAAASACLLRLVLKQRRCK
jgi:hypothetical protein